MSVAAHQPHLPVESHDFIQWYLADSRLGTIHIGVAITNSVASVLEGPHRVLQQGLVLADVELVVQVIELWLDVELDLIPAASVSRDASRPGDQTETMDAHICSIAADTLPEVHLSIPLPSLDQIKAVDAVLTEQLNFQWSSLQLELTLEEMSFSPSEMADIERGSLVLLSSSYQSPWTIYGRFPAMPSLRLAAGLNPVSCQLEHPRLIEPVTKENQEKADAQHGFVVSIRAEQPSVFYPDELLGFNAVDKPFLHDIEQSYWVMVCDGRMIGRGRLVPVAQGFGFVLIEMNT